VLRPSAAASGTRPNCDRFPTHHRLTLVLQAPVAETGTHCMFIGSADTKISNT
jgi:hypothetical protein